MNNENKKTVLDHFELCEIMEELDKRLYNMMIKGRLKTSRESVLYRQFTRWMLRSKCHFEELIFKDDPETVAKIDETFDRHMILSVYYGNEEKREKLKAWLIEQGEKKG
jgi:hypothetical protein